MSYTCISLECREESAPPFESDDLKPICPKCGYNNAIRRIPTVHLLTRDRLGTIVGYGANYRVACGQDVKSVRHATGVPKAANCPKCLATIPSKDPESEQDNLDPVAYQK